MTAPDESQLAEFPPPPDNLPGLTETEAGQRLRAQGPNLLVPNKRRSGWWSVVWRSVTEPMSILLVIAAVTYLLLGDAVDGIAAIVALLPIVGVSVVLERRAERAAISQAFERIANRAGVPRIRLHDVRHTHGTLLIKAGVPVKVVSERLGHGNPAFTIETYQHVLPGMQAEAARTFEKLINEARPETPGRRPGRRIA